MDETQENGAREKVYGKTWAEHWHVTMTIYKRKSAGRKNNNIDLNVTFNRKEDRQSKCEWGWTQRALTLS